MTLGVQDGAVLDEQTDLQAIAHDTHKAFTVDVEVSGEQPCHIVYINTEVFRVREDFEEVAPYGVPLISELTAETSNFQVVAHINVVAEKAHPIFG